MNQQLIDKLKNFVILYLEDEDGLRQRVVNTLKYYFDEVYCASNVADAWEIFNNNTIDLIFCDIEISGQKENGIDFVKKIRTNNNQTPIVMVTAYTTQKYLLELINLKIDYYIKKPINADKLFLAIEIALKPKLNSLVPLGGRLVFDLTNECLTQDSLEVKLTKKEKRFLRLLIHNKSRVTTYEMIEYELWSDSVMSESALKSFIKEFRKKVPTLNLQNISKEGYKLIL